MKPRIPKLPTALMGMCLFAQPLMAQAPTDTTDAEKAAMAKDAVSMAPAADEASRKAQADLKTDEADSAAATKAVDTFLVQAEIPAEPVPAPVPPPNQPLDLEPGPDDTVIRCEAGMYFDPVEGVLVYRKNVTVKDPRLNLSGANELKVFFSKKEEKPGAPKEPKNKDDKPKFGANLGSNFGDVERIVATGAVVLDQKPADGKEAIKASGAFLSYNVKTDQVTIKGGYPWILQGKNFLRAKEPDLILRIAPKAGTFVTEGVWEMGGSVERKK